MQKRLIIVSNRLPVTIDEVFKTRKKNIGGLVTGLSSYIEKINREETCFNDYIWFGWPGKFVENKHRGFLTKEYFKKYKCFPVFLEPETIKGFYEEYSNDVIWPLFHCFPEKVKNHKNSWTAYYNANKVFYETIKGQIKEGDFIWVHDYHLMLLPQMIRNDFKQVTISFFLHIPFPDLSLFQILPKQIRKSLLIGLSGANLIGFHCFSYLENFTKAIRKTLKLTDDNYVFRLQDRTFKLDVFPMGVDFKEIIKITKSVQCQEIKEVFKENLSGCKLIISIDRLDYTKGIINRLKAYYNFLSEYPHWKKKVTFKLIVAPSRRNVKSYRDLKLKIDKWVGRINGVFSTHDWVPIHYHYDQYDLTQLCALYELCDMALITPLRDGMNLIAKEFIAANDPKKGVLILSESAGAVFELADAIIVNAYRVEEIKEAMYRALTMSQQEKYLSNNRMALRLKAYDVYNWVDDIVNMTGKAKELPLENKVKMIDGKIRENMLEALKKSASPLFILDYDGTLSPIDKNKIDPKPSLDLLSSLARIQQFSNAKIIIVSGRTKHFLNECFSHLNISLVSDFGGWILDENEWKLLSPVDESWKAEAENLISKYVMKLPNTLMESKENIVVWDYRMAEYELKELRIKELLTEVNNNQTLKKTTNYMVGQNNFILKSTGAGKGEAVKYCLARGTYDFIFSAGDDDADEEIFEVLPEGAYTIKVGGGNTKAGFVCKDHLTILNILEDFSLIEHQVLEKN